MASPFALIFIVTIFSMTSLISSVPPVDLMERSVDEISNPEDNKLVVQELMDKLDLTYPDIQPQQRTNFANLFNLTAALANAPRNTTALTKIPLITLLFG